MNIVRACAAPFGFLARHARGEYPMGRAYWLHYLPAAWFPALLLPLPLAYISESYSAAVVFLSIVLVWSIGLATWLWGAVGAWASANQHIQRSGKTGWARAVKIAIVLALLRNVSDMLERGPATFEFFGTMNRLQSSAAMQTTLQDEGRTLLFTGGINDGAANFLRSALDASPGVQRVILRSPGGWVAQGMKMAELIAQRGLDTHVDAECSSACTLAFIAGKERTAGPDGKLGFHTFHSIGAIDEFDRMNDALGAEKTYRHAGLPQAFIDKIVATRADQIWYPSQEELRRAKILTVMADSNAEAPAIATPTSPQDLMAILKGYPSFAALARRYPQDFDTLIQTTWNQIDQHTTVEEMLLVEQLYLSRAVTELLPEAADAVVLEYGHFSLNYYVALAHQGGVNCSPTIAASDVDEDMSTISKREMIVRQSAIAAMVIRNSATHRRNLFSRRKTNTILGQARTAARAAQDVTEESPIDGPRLCESIMFHQRLETQALPKRVEALRAMYQFMREHAEASEIR